MTLPVVNIINLKKRADRRKDVSLEMMRHDIPYVFWDGIEMKPVKTGISKAHKQIVRFAKETKKDFVVIGEDDIEFTAPKAYEYFIKNIPQDYDIYLSGYYFGRPDENNIIAKFSGLSLYIVHSKYYDSFLEADEHYHLDTALCMKGGKFVVCDRFIATQKEGYSDNVKKVVNYEKRIAGKPLFK